MPKQIKPIISKPKTGRTGINRKFDSIMLGISSVAGDYNYFLATDLNTRGKDLEKENRVSIMGTNKKILVNTERLMLSIPLSIAFGYIAATFISMWISPFIMVATFYFFYKFEPPKREKS